MDYKDKKIIIIGYGIEGQAVAKYLYPQGAKITIADQKDLSELPAEAVQQFSTQEVKWVTGASYLDNLGQYDLICFSPGLKYENYQKIISAGIPVTTQIKIFFDHTPTKNIIGVTGTNGKGTTTKMIHDILVAAGKTVYLGGNIGIEVLPLLDKLKPDDWVVLELSSYQLRDLDVSPHIGVLLNITSDHIDIHQTQEDYEQSKANLIRFQTTDDFAVVNGDYEVTKKLAKLSKAELKYFYAKDIDTSVINLPIPGQHNLENAAAAKKVSEIVGIDDETVVKVLNSFEGLHHRLEKVASVKGVDFYDDSISTIPHTTMAAVHSFKQPVILILGGSKKSADYNELARPLKEAKNIKTLLITGDTGPEIKEALEKVNYQGQTYEGFDNIKQVVTKAFSLAQPGDIVLLSPASASFNWFKNYADRGEKYLQAIKKLNK